MITDEFVWLVVEVVVVDKRMAVVLLGLDDPTENLVELVGIVPQLVSDQGFIPSHERLADDAHHVHFVRYAHIEKQIH